MSEIWEAGKRPEHWPSFGSVLRGMRIGYRWSDAHKCFIRISTPGNLILIEVAPDKGIPSKQAPDDDYRCWWDEPDLLDKCPAIAALGPVTKYQRIYVDDNGEIVSK